MSLLADGSLDIEESKVFVLLARSSCFLSLEPETVKKTPMKMDPMVLWHETFFLSLIPDCSDSDFGICRLWYTLYLQFFSSFSSVYFLSCKYMKNVE